MILIELKLPLCFESAKKLSKYGKVAVAELVFYCPILFTNIWVAKRRTFDRCTAWIYLFLLAVILVIGASLQLQSELNTEEFTHYISCNSVRCRRCSLGNVYELASEEGVSPPMHLAFASSCGDMRI